MSLLMLQAEGCCSSVCGDFTRSIQAMRWKEKPTSGYGSFHSPQMTGMAGSIKKPIHRSSSRLGEQCRCMKVLCQLATEEDDAAAQALMKQMGVPPKEYHLKVLRKLSSFLHFRWCPCDNILATSVACVPLVTYPEAAPLIGALLQQPVTCVRAALSEDFLDALSSAYSSQCLCLEEQAVVSLWCHNLSSLEKAVLSLLECVLTKTGSTPQKLKQQLAQSLLPKASAQHWTIFLIVNDIFRSILKQAEGNESVKCVIQTFTNCFLQERALLQHQTSVSLKAFFPQSPQSLLVPLLTRPSEMPQDVWRHHLNWLSGSLQRLTEEEEDGDGDGDSSSSTRGHHKLFESWFLLVQCAHWVQVAVQLLSLVPLLSPQPQQPSLSPYVTLKLLVNFAVFSHQSLSGSTEILQAVVERSGLVDEAACVLRSLELRLTEGSCLSSDANRVHLRIKALQDTLTHMHAASRLSDPLLEFYREEEEGEPSGPSYAKLLSSPSAADLEEKDKFRLKHSRTFGGCLRSSGGTVRVCSV
ncbi:hypothetical protein FQN60_018459 [Etheostoma spectabile]|uniref:Uncharacterized protein n=1 Tax=Etheostoma spectabile TaxID=54343 RepID=A0A5J5DI02_9PERO|nr:hypothetical protein FQN60_018459 [Etheostoma spectabile]